MKSIELVLLAAALLALGGCATSSTPIELRDQRVVVPSVKASVRFGRGEAEPSRPQSGHALELEYSRIKGRDDQTLAVGQADVRFGGQTFSPPQQLRHEFTFDYADIAWRWRRFFGGGDLGLEAIAGLGYADLQLVTSSATLRATDGMHTRGAKGGVGLVWRAAPTTSVQLRHSVFLSRIFYSASDRLKSVERTELFLNQALGRNVTLRVGYTGWEVDADSRSNSDVRLRFSGPSVGLQFDFGP